MEMMWNSYNHIRTNVASLALVALGLVSFSAILWVAVVEAYSSGDFLGTLSLLILVAGMTWYAVFRTFFKEGEPKKGVLKKALTTTFLLSIVLMVGYPTLWSPYEVQLGHVRISETGEVFTEGDIVPRTVFRLSSTDVDLTTYSSSPWKKHNLGYIFRGPAEVRISMTTYVVWNTKSEKFQQVASRFADDLYGAEELLPVLEAKILSPLVMVSVDKLLTKNPLDGTSLKLRLGAIMNKVHNSEPAITAISIRKVRVTQVIVQKP